MKKIISLLASIAMLATMVTSVSAAEIANNAPSIDTTVVEMSAEDYAAESGSELEEGQVAYMITATITGLDLSMVRGGSSNNAEKKTRTGVGLMSAQYDIVWDSEDNFVDWMSIDDGLAAAGSTIKSAFLATKVTDAYPTTTNNASAPVETDEAYLNTYIVVVSGELTGKVEALLSMKEFNMDVVVETKNFKKTDVTYTVNGNETDVVTLAGPAQGGEEPAETEVVVSEKIDLESNGVIGAAWDVTIKNFDSAKDYMAKFVDADTEEERIGGEKAIDVSEFAETEGDLGFAVIMRLTTARNVALSIAIK